MWQEMYLILFRAATRALAQMQTQNFGLAAEELKQAQCCAEELFLAEKE